MRSLLRFIWVGNPFYVVSAALVLHGLSTLFDRTREPDDAWALLALIALYAVLLAGTAVWIIRKGRVWDDARTILLVIILLFIALSVIFDERVILDRASGAALLAGGWLFSALLSEGLLRGLGIRLAAGFRIPYHALLALFFVYPNVLASLLHGPWQDALPWVALAFPAVAALAFLGLLPAVRQGREYVARNGTPWPWPLFPWTIFLFFLLGVCGRSYYATISFVPGPGAESVFSPWFLTPLVLVASVLLFEAGIVAARSGVRLVALLVPVGVPLLFLSPTELGVEQSRFLARLVDAAGSPLHLALAAATLFYAWAWWRREGRAELGVIACLIAFVFAGDSGFGIRSIHELAWLPIGLAALNPHASEGSQFGDEERKHLLPAAQRARARPLRFM